MNDHELYFIGFCIYVSSVAAICVYIILGKVSLI